MRLIGVLQGAPRGAAAAVSDAGIDELLRRPRGERDPRLAERVETLARGKVTRSLLPTLDGASGNEETRRRLGGTGVDVDNIAWADDFTSAAHRDGLG